MAQIDYFKDVMIICVTILTILPVEKYRRDEIKIADLENGIKTALYHLFYSLITGHSTTSSKKVNTFIEKWKRLNLWIWTFFEFPIFGIIMVHII